MNLTLARDLLTATCTMGMLSVGDSAYQTMELPWKDNQHGVSCVPDGDYMLEKHSSEMHPKTWALVNPALHVTHFPDPAHTDWRSLCLIHAANWASQLQGCIAPGMSRIYVGGVWMVQQSQRAMAAIQAIVPWTDGHILMIRSVH